MSRHHKKAKVLAVMVKEQVRWKRRVFLSLSAGAALSGLLVATGCGGAGPAFHPVIGTVQLAEGDGSVLAGHGVEAVLESDNLVRANGVIAADGQFSLETLHEGAVRRGALAGKYKARIVLADDDGEARRRAASVLPKKSLQFETSGLAFEVPTAESIQLRISK